MTPGQFQRVADLFDRLCDTPPDQRTADLARLCPDDPVVRRRVAALLDRDGSSAVHLTAKALDATLPADAHAARRTATTLPDRIGGFRILDRIGEGGMGIVLKARQHQPARTVALKLLRDVHASDDALRRFRREIELLGQLDHPGIAHIYEAGSLDLPNGATQPYFAMEYIDGQPITQYAAAAALNATRRLELLLQVCDAVQFAHDRGVLHRDLKPGNILVKTVGAAAGNGGGSAPHGVMPKVLDFGVGRLLARDADAATLQTRTGQLVGTLAYMSPEQLAGSAADLDCRSDVYALGVILYELLAGCLPLDLRGASIVESIRRVRDEDPPSLGAVDRVYRGDVATVVAKAMAKDRAQRYASAGALAADLRRFLSDEPIVARPATTWYQLRKFARRHKAIVAGTSVALAALLVAVALTSWQAVAANAARADAERQAHRAIQVKEFLKDILESAAPGERPDKTVSATDLLDRAADRLAGGDFGADPEIAAELRLTLGAGYLALGRYAAADEHYAWAQAALAERPDQQRGLMSALEGRGAAAELQNRYAAAEAHYRDALAIWDRIGQPGQPPPGVWPHGLPSVLYATGRYDEALAEYQQAVAFIRAHRPPDDPELAAALGGLGAVLEALSQPDDAIAAHQEAAAIYRAALGDRNVHLANSLNNLGNAQQGKGATEAAARSHREALAIRRGILRDDHPDVAMSLSNLALVLFDLGALEEAEEMNRAALAIRSRVLPAAHHSTAATLHNLASVLREQERFPEALATYDQAIAMAEAVVGRDHMMPLVFRANRAFCRFRMGDVDAARERLEVCYSQLSEMLGSDHRRVRHIAADLARLYDASGQPEQARRWHDRR